MRGLIPKASWLEKSKALMESPFKGKTGFRRLKNAFFYSIEGLREAYRCEDAFRQEVRLLIFLVAISAFLPVRNFERALMICSIFIVLIVELINSAIEAAIDRIGFERHALSKRAKDIGSAAVMVAIVNAVAVWACILLDT